MKIKITDFALRHFKSKNIGTKINGITPEDFEIFINSYSDTINWMIKDLDKPIDKDKFFSFDDDLEHVNELDYIESNQVDANGGIRDKAQLHTLLVSRGYAPFCKLVSIPTLYVDPNIRLGTTEITMDNYQYLRSGYSERREGELPVLSRWLELPIKPAIAEYLVVILYSKEQINKENNDYYHKQMIKFENGDIKEKPLLPEHFSDDWGIVSFNAQKLKYEEPMNPVTMMRNSLGRGEGGSGVEINQKKYQKSVDFWSTHAIIK